MLTKYADEEGRLTERYIQYYEQKARGGWGLIICEDHAVDPKAIGFTHIPGLWSDDLMKEHVELVDRVHEAGAKIAVQLYHAGRQSHSSVIGEQTVAPSAIQDPVMGETPRALEIDEIETLVEKFAQAAKRSVEAGYDAIELHGAHGYLINQFLSPFSNKRTDRYGGNLKNRMRFPLEIIKRIKALIGEDFPIIFRISADELVDGGLRIEDTATMAMILEEAGIAAMHVSGGVYKSSATLCAPTTEETAVFSKYAEAIKKVVDIPVITVNKIAYPEVAERLLRQGKADFVSMGRASIADPELPVKAKEGRSDEIRYCIGCRQGCWNHLLIDKPVTCLVNPSVGIEDHSLRPVESAKKVTVIGGGPVGMEAARIAARRGHQVSLYERGSQLGGQWKLAAVPPGKEILNTLTVWQEKALERAGVNVHRGVEATAELIRKESPDRVIIATGATPIVPNIKGADKAHVHTAHDVLKGQVNLAGEVVVIGGGLVGAETAEHIAVHNVKTSIVELQSEIAGDMEGGTRQYLMESLEANRVDLLTDSRVLEIQDDKVVIERNEDTEEIAASLVVMAIGSRSENHLVEELRSEFEVDVIGDAFSVGKALDGMAMAYQTAMDI